MTGAPFFFVVQETLQSNLAGQIQIALPVMETVLTTVRLYPT